MTPSLFALLERAHGHLGWLGLAVLLHPVLTLGRRGAVTRGMRWSAGLAAALIAAPYALGWAIYPTYRAHIKPGLVRETVSVALAFETKEHLALFTLALTLSGVAALWAGGRSPEGRRAARVLLTAAWLCGVAVGALGIFVASVAHPAW